MNVPTQKHTADYIKVLIYVPCKHTPALHTRNLPHQSSKQQPEIESGDPVIIPCDICMFMRLSFSFAPSLPPHLSATQTTQYPTMGSERVHTFLDGRWQVNNRFQQQRCRINQSEVSPTHTSTHPPHINPNNTTSPQTQ